jgi:hypothetical protein
VKAHHFQHPQSHVCIGDACRITSKSFSFWFLMNGDQQFLPAARVTSKIAKSTCHRQPNMLFPPLISVKCRGLVCAQVPKHARTHKFIRTHTHTHKARSQKQRRIHIHTRIYMHACMHTYMHACVCDGPGMESFRTWLTSLFSASGTCSLCMLALTYCADSKHVFGKSVHRGSATVLFSLFYNCNNMRVSMPFLFASSSMYFPQKPPQWNEYRGKRSVLDS